jgi:uncharacterized protein with FMN-binding domain
VELVVYQTRGREYPTDSTLKEILVASSSRRPKQNKAGVPAASASRARKGKLSGGIIAISSAAIVSVYALGRANSNAVSNPLMVESPTAAASAAPSAGATVAASTSRNQPASTPIATYKDGSYTGSGDSRHGGMQVKVVIKNGKIASANVASCSTRYSCSDVDPLVSEAVSRQGVPVHYVSGSTDSSQAYKQALTSALRQAKA